MSVLYVLVHSQGGISIIVVDLRNPKPIYEQIKDNLKRLIISGALTPDEKLPSVRELAQSTSINPNTIQKAFKDLETEGFIYTVVGRGNFVAASPGCKDTGRIEGLKHDIQKAASELLFLGVPKKEIMGLIDSLMIANEEGSAK